MPLLLGLLGVGKWLRELAMKLPWQIYAALGVVIALLLAWHVIAVRERHAWNAGFNVAWAHEQRTIAAVRVASAKATLDQLAANAQPALKSQAIAEQSNANSPAYYADVRRAAAAYAAAHRVRGTGAADCRSGGPDLPSQDQAPEKHDGPGDAAEYVAVTRADFDILTGNSARLAKVHQDAEQLIAAEVAE